MLSLCYPVPGPENTGPCKAGGTGPGFLLPPNIAREEELSFVDNVSDKTHTAMHFHTFIRPGLADQTVVPEDIPPGHTITMISNAFSYIHSSRFGRPDCGTGGCPPGSYHHK
jgi:hypothetical protein